MRKSSTTTRLLGMPVVPPVSKTYAGLPARPLGIQRVTGPPRSLSSSKWPNFARSAYFWTSFRGSQPACLAQSSQKGEPVSGEKCHLMVSRTCASRRCCASRTLTSLGCVVFWGIGRGLGTFCRAGTTRGPAGTPLKVGGAPLLLGSDREELVHAHDVER